MQAQVHGTLQLPPESPPRTAFFSKWMLSYREFKQLVQDPTIPYGGCLPKQLFSPLFLLLVLLLILFSEETRAHPFLIPQLSPQLFKVQAWPRQAKS